MKRILSIICIIFLIGITSVVPYYSTSYFVYAEENNNPVVGVTDTIQAGIDIYLNTRNGFLIAANGGIDAVKTVIQAYLQTYYKIDSAHFTNDTLAGNIIIKYSPFRVSLKGPAVRFFNDMVDWLIDTGKLTNADNSNGGNTTDSIYNGKMFSGHLFSIFNSQNATDFYAGSTNVCKKIPANKVDIGSIVDLFDGQYAYNLFLINNPNFNINSSIDGNSYSHNITYSANTTKSVIISTSTSGQYLTAFNIPNNYIRASNRIPLYNEEGDSYYGGAYWYLDRNEPNKMYYGIMSLNKNTNYYFYKSFGSVNMSNEAQDISVNFDTTDFDKNDQTVPDEGKEVQYTPSDKTTGDTYNTYNEYVTNYYQKNTVINKTIINEDESGNDDPTEPTNPPGGTVPDWSGGGGSGTITPDGNGGYTFELPDFSLPDLDIDWSISGLTEKFPFSIPFDLLAFFTVLNAEPETPAIEATIPLGLWEWEIDWDLHNFDTLAALLRNLEFIGFCIGLALITRNIIKG